ncbi:MAG: adenylyl-sulfate kinase [Lachnospiraceae bacterium]|nr:adenylyl-sulfate kinase [Lachnospiraceae bacterium]
MMYLIGMSGSGKTTIARELEKRLRNRGVQSLQYIDGDEIRQELGGMFGYTPEERMKNNKVVCVVIKYLLKNNISVILSQVGARQAMRDQVKEHADDKYIEVYVKCSREECIKRDVKGYYKKAEKGEMDNLNGSTDLFDEPEKYDIIIDTQVLTVEQSVDIIMNYLENNGYVI